MEMFGFNQDHTNAEIDVAANLEVVRAHVRALAVAAGDASGGRDGQIEMLEWLLHEVPQLDEHKRPQYLLTSGLAVELMTGFERPHHDIDLVIMDPKKLPSWELWGTDNVTPGQYWADMAFDPIFLSNTRKVVRTRPDKDAPFVGCINPAIILVQKLSDCFGRKPRRRDADDAEALVKHLKATNTPETMDIIAASIDALPTVQQQKTLERLQDVWGLSKAARFLGHTALHR